MEHPVNRAKLLSSLAFAVALASVLAAVSAGAQTADSNYPDRAIKIINASPAGGGVDTVTRIVANQLEKLWGQPVTVENRSGASSNIAGAVVAKAEPNGYTLLATPPNTLTVNAVLFRNLTYDPTALEPVAIMAFSHNVLAVKIDLPVKSVGDLIALAKANPGKLSYASQGSGSTTHLSAELFQTRTGAKLVHVPFRGSAPALNDLAGGHVDVMFCDLGSTLPLHRGGKVRIIAAATMDRPPELPDLPTISESGLKDFSSTTFFALMAPPNTPPEIRAKLNNAIVAATQLPEVQASLKRSFLQSSTMDIKQMGEFVKAEAKIWGEVIRAANITVVQ